MCWGEVGSGKVVELFHLRYVRAKGALKMDGEIKKNKGEVL